MHKYIMQIPTKYSLSNYYLNHTVHETAENFAVSKSTIGNWLKHYGVTKHKNINCPFNSIQIDLITGSLLGDGSLTKPPTSRGNSCFTETHCLLQKEYLEWKYELLKPFSSRLKEFTTAKEQKLFVECYMATVKHPLFTDLEKKWYLRDCDGNYVLKNGKRIKILPEDLSLNEFSISVWFLDDGNVYAPKRAAIFCTDCFSHEEVQRLSDMLLTFGIQTTVRPLRQGRCWHIAVRTCSYLSLLNMVESNISCKCMSYKTNTDNYIPPISMIGEGHPLAKLKNSDIGAISQLIKLGIERKKISEKYGISTKTLSNIMRGRTWTSISKINSSSLQKYNSKSGIVGISFKQGRWHSRILVNGERLFLGAYKDLDTAAAIRHTAEEMKKSGIIDKEKYLRLKQ
jgi:hypothetical protein